MEARIVQIAAASRGEAIVDGSAARQLPTPRATIVWLELAREAGVMPTGDSRRDAILSDLGILDAVRIVIRKRGVSEQEAEDVLHDVIEDACDDSSLPLDDKEQARAYLCGCARYKSIDHAHERVKEAQRRDYVEDLDTYRSPRVSVEDHTLAREILAQARKKYRFTHGWFERFFMGEETHREIAADPRVTSEHVRHEVSKIRRSLQAFALAGLALLVSAIAVRAWKVLTPHHGEEPVATPVTPAPKGPPIPSIVPSAHPPEAVALRDRARKECASGDWQECVEDLDRASALDPQGDSPELRDLHNRAAQHLESFEAKPKR